MSPSTAPELLGGGRGDGPGMAPGLAGGADDRIERARRVGAQLLDAGDRLAAPLHLARDRRDLGGDLLQQRARFARRVQALRRQVAHLVGDDREPASFGPGACRLDGRVERDEIGQVGDLADGADEAL